MHPSIHSLLLFLLATGGMIAGASGGLQVYHSWGERALGVISFPFLFLGIGLVCFYSMIHVWDRYVPVYCPRCRGTMTKKGIGKSFFFTCTSCGHSQFG